MASRGKTVYDRGPSPFPWRGLLCITGFQGYLEQPVLVVGTTKASWRIEALDRTRLSGFKHYLEKGERALVPHSSVKRFVEASEPVQVELDLRQTSLPFKSGSTSTACDDCDQAAILNRKCDRHVTPASSGRHAHLERRKKRT